MTNLTNINFFISSLFKRSDSIEKLAVWLEEKSPKRLIPWKNWLNGEGGDGDQPDEDFIKNHLAKM